jgi:hypothetical protein
MYNISRLITYNVVSSRLGLLSYVMYILKASTKTQNCDFTSQFNKKEIIFCTTLSVFGFLESAFVNSLLN